MFFLNSFKRNFFIFVACTSISACAIKPIPGDYFPLKTRLDKGDNTQHNITTSKIVEQIRCEARHAIATVSTSYIDETVRRLLKTNGNSPAKQIAQEISAGGEVSFERLIDLYNSKDGKFDTRLQNLISPDSLKKGENPFSIMEAFAKSGIGYTFKFTISEDNKATAGILNFNLPRDNGSTTLGVGGSYDRIRKNTRTFSLAETIADIAQDKGLRGRGDCNERNFKTVSNYHFPITGKVGLMETIRTYTELVLIFGLDDNKSLTKTLNQKNTMTDDLIFTTTVTGNLNPSIKLTPATTVPSLADGKIGLSNVRTDVHQLTLLLKPDGINKVLEDLRFERILDGANNTLALSQ